MFTITPVGGPDPPQHGLGRRDRAEGVRVEQQRPLQRFAFILV
jgi:hypothetical protein